LGCYGGLSFDPHRLHDFGKPCQYRPMGGFHMVDFHWLVHVTCHHTIHPLVRHFSTCNCTTWITPVITLICTRHTYLTLGHPICLLCQASTEQLFLKNILYTGPRALLHYCTHVHGSCSNTAHVYLQNHRKKESC